MITPKQALELSEYRRLELRTDNAIKFAASNDYLHVNVHVNGNSSYAINRLIKTLEELGYTISIDPQSLGDVINIAWGITEV
ncbi:hypothetical protein [Weissella tructae]